MIFLTKIPNLRKQFEGGGGRGGICGNNSGGGGGGEGKWVSDLF